MSVDASNRLSDLAARVREAEAASETASIEAAERALEAGRLLMEAKAECRHGEWLPFLAKAGLSERNAQRRMLLARSGLKSVTVSDLGIRGALDLAAKRKLPKVGEMLIVFAADPETGADDLLVCVMPEDGGYTLVGVRHDSDVPAVIETVASGDVAEVFARVDVLLLCRWSTMRFVTAEISPSEIAAEALVGYLSRAFEPDQMKAFAAWMERGGDPRQMANAIRRKMGLPTKLTPEEEHQVADMMAIWSTLKPAQRAAVAMSIAHARMPNGELGPIN